MSLPNILQFWECLHIEKILRQLKKEKIELIPENIPLIIERTSFRVRSQNYTPDCPCYQLQRPCHEDIRDLNCFLCNCPQYNSLTDQGACKIQSRFGRYIEPAITSTGKVWTCEDCGAYHHPDSVRIFLEKHLKDLAELSKIL